LLTATSSTPLPCPAPRLAPRLSASINAAASTRVNQHAASEALVFRAPLASLTGPEDQRQVIGRTAIQRNEITWCFTNYTPQISDGAFASSLTAVELRPWFLGRTAGDPCRGPADGEAAILHPPSGDVPLERLSSSQQGANDDADARSPPAPAFSNTCSHEVSCTSDTSASLRTGAVACFCRSADVTEAAEPAVRLCPCCEGPMGIYRVHDGQAGSPRGVPSGSSSGYLVS
jgi:hypothetical protein